MSGDVETALAAPRAGLAGRLIGAFVTPVGGFAAGVRDEDPQRAAARACARATVVVLGGPEVGGVATAVARALARRAITPLGVVATVGCHVQHLVPASPAAGRAVRRLRARGVDCQGHGRLVVVGVAGQEQALADAARVAAAAGGGADVPTVVAVAEPRSAALDAHLGVCDAVVLCGSPELLAVAASRVRARHPAARVVTAENPAGRTSLAPAARAAAHAVVAAVTA